MQSTDWAAEHSDALREYLAKGMSFSKIAGAINTKFNTAYSRSAAIGRAKRMGLAVAERTRPLPNTPQPNLHKLREHYALASRWFVPEFGR